MFDFPAVYQAYIACRRNKRASHNTQRYEVRLLDHLVTTSNALQSRRWSPARSVSFVCTRPKAREIHAADFADRVVHHLLVPRLEALYEPLFIHDSYSNRKGKGTHAAVNQLQRFMRKVTCNGKRKAFFLQLDIRNFFNRIHRTVLLQILQARLLKSRAQQQISATEHDEMLWLCSVLLRENAAQGAILRGAPASFDAVPEYKRLALAPEDCGIAIGNLTSQFFANVYLNALDQFIKHDLKCRYYLRYVDDFVLLDESEERLLMWREKIQVYLSDKLKLELKELAKPVAVSSGCDFLGYVTRPHYKLVRRRVLHHCMERLNALQSLMLREQKNGMSLYLKTEHRESLQATLASYWGHYLHASSFQLKQSIFCSFSWLNIFFQLRHDSNDRRELLPRWQPPCITSFQSQLTWFQAQYHGFIQLIQVGKSFARVGKDKHVFPLAVQQMMRKSPTLSILQDVYVIPLSMLKGVRSLLRYTGVAYIFVAEEGYLKGGLKRRVLRLLWLPSEMACLMMNQ